MPSPSSWDPAWDEVVVVISTSAAYALAAVRFRPERWRLVAFTASQLLVLAVFVTPLGTLSLNYLLSAHLFQNVALAEWAPALAVLGLSPAMAAALAHLPPLRALSHPFVALPIWLVTYGVWHIPAIYDAALESHLLLHLEHGTYFASGVLLWWPVFHDSPREVSDGARAVYLFAAFLFASPVGLLLGLLPSAVYDFYVEAPRIWGLTALEDQQLAGLIMAGSEAIVFFAAFAWFFLRFLAEEGRVRVGS